MLARIIELLDRHEAIEISQLQLQLGEYGECRLEGFSGLSQELRDCLRFLLTHRHVSVDERGRIRLCSTKVLPFRGGARA
jgi:hypothetical protein